ncbi:unnamed protein product [Closterium sp. NIES-64]|nr:unnamed protein product [Closterium sp. NIES-64]
MEPATSPYSPVRCSARSTAGVPAPSDDMVYYGPGTSSPRPNARHARGPSPSAAGARRDDPDTDTEYLPWADRQDERLDVEDDDEEEDNWMPEEEPVDEDAEAEQREVRPLSEVIASSTQATSKEQRPGGRGPTLNRRGTASANAPGNPGAALDNAIAGRVAKQEQRIHELNQTIERLEGNRATAARSASPRATNRPSRARDAAVDEPAPCRQHTAAGRVSSRQADATGEPRSPMVERALAREIPTGEYGGSRHTRDGVLGRPLTGSARYVSVEG